MGVLLSALPPSLLSAAGAAGGAVRDAAEAVGGAVREAAGAAGGAVRDAAGVAGGAVRDAAGVAGSAVRDAAGAAGGAVRDAAEAVALGAGGVLTSVGAAVHGEAGEGGGGAAAAAVGLRTVQVSSAAGPPCSVRLRPPYHPHGAPAVLAPQVRMMREQLELANTTGGVVEQLLLGTTLSAGQAAVRERRGFSLRERSPGSSRLASGRVRWRAPALWPFVAQDHNPNPNPNPNPALCRAGR